MSHLKSTIRNPQSAIDFLLGLLFLALYVFTLVPSVLPADSGEFQLVAWKLGIAHPPGYPLYTLVGWLFSRFFASPALALNLLSAVLAAATLAIVSRTVRMLTQSVVAGVLAASLLGVSTTFWAQATTANIRMPAAFFTALCVSLLVAWSRSRAVGDQGLGIGDRASGIRERGSGYLVFFAFVFALGLSHHLSLLFPGIFFILYILLVDPTLLRQPRRWLKPLGFFTLGLLPFLYLPLRGATGGTFANGEPAAFLAQPDQFLSYISGRGFEGDFFYFINTRPDLFLDRVKLLPTLFDFQFNWLVFVLFIVGAARLAIRDWRLAIMLLGGIVLHTFVTLAYRAPQTVEYLMPAYVLMTIVAGYSLGKFGMGSTDREAPPSGCGMPRVPRYVLRIAAYALRLACCVAIVLLFASHFSSFRWLNANEDTRAYSERLLNAAPPNAILLSNWHWANPLWYLQQVEGQRPDVEVQYIFPRGEALAQSWLNGIDAGLKSGRPVVVDMAFHPEFENSPYFFTPLATDAYEVRSMPLHDRPASFAEANINFDDKFSVIGQQLLMPAARAGEPLTLLLAYRVETKPDPATSFFVHLVRPDGSVIGQADKTVQTGRYQAGDVIVERFKVTPLIDVPPGEYQLLAGAYTVGPDGEIAPLKANGAERVPVARARVEAPDRLIAPEGINLAEGVIYLASDTAPLEVKPGDELKVNLNFTAARPLLRDTVVSVQMMGNGWHVADDFVPALGAIPTLKWIAGSPVSDPHTLKIPENATPGPAQLSVILYDNFTQEPLALLDAELIKQGQAIPLGTVNVTR